MDSTPLGFWTQLTASLAGLDGATAAALPSRPPETGTLASMPELVEWLHTATCDWIVIDGLDAETHAGCLPSLAYLIGNLPPPVRLVVTTHDASHRVPADAADRRVTVIDREQLAATADEAALIALASAPGLDVDNLEEIVSAAGGWVAAIRAAARYAAHHPTGNAGYWLTSQGAGTLLGPWLDRLPADRLQFLLDTLVLDWLAGPLCDSTLETSGSLADLEALEAHGSYLTSCLPPATSADLSLRWWRRHPLVTAALAQRAPLVDQSERNLRAASWFMENGFFDPAMRHLMAAGRLEEAGRYLSAHENALFEAGKGQNAAAWYASLPPDSWGPLGWHLVRMGWGQAISRESHAAGTTLAQLRAHLAASPGDDSEQRVLQAETATLAAYVSSMAGDTTTVISSARRAIDLFCEESPDNSQQVAPATLIRALLWEGDVSAARRELTRIAFQPFPTGILREALLGGLKAQCLTDEGRIHEAQHEVRKALRWLGSQRLDPRDVGQFSLMTADGATTLESGDIAGAMLRLRTAAATAQESGMIGDAAVALDWRARTHIAAGQLGEALACVIEARRLLHESAPTSPILFRLDLTEAFIRHLGGDAVRAERLVQHVPASDARTLMWARVTMHRQASGVRRALASITTDTPRVSIEKQVLLAMVAMKRSNALAESHLTHAAGIAGGNGFQLAILGCPADLLELASTLASRTSHDALQQLARLPYAPQAEHVDDAPPVIVQGSTAGTPLSAGELELLTFLPRRDTNADIARQLGVSVNTIKTRLYRLYRKLGVDSRDAALQVARTRGLIT